MLQMWEIVVMGGVVAHDFVNGWHGIAVTG